MHFSCTLNTALLLQFLQKHIRKMQSKCGPCPRAEWQGCTFEGTDLAMLAHLEVTATPRSLNTTKIA